MSSSNLLPVCAPLFDWSLRSCECFPSTVGGGDTLPKSRSMATVLCDRAQHRKLLPAGVCWGGCAADALAPPPPLPGSLLHCQAAGVLPLPQWAGPPRNETLVCAGCCGDRRGGFSAFSSRVVVGIGLGASALLVACKAATAGFGLYVRICSSR